MSRKILLVLIITLVFITPVFAEFDGLTPNGANTAQDLFSPSMAGSGGFTTSKGGAPASALNPAAEGDAQRIIFDIGYLGLPSFFGDPIFDWKGNVVNLGAIFPTRVGVFGGSLKVINSFSNVFLNNTTTFMGNLNAAKEIYPGMNIGLGLNFGYTTPDRFTLSADLGVRQNLGTIGVFENFTWAAVVRGLGVSWIPTAITPAGGVSFDFVHLRGEEGKPSPFKMGFSADVLFPSFQNFAGQAGVNMVIADLVTVSAASQFNIGEMIQGRAPSLIPSIGIMVNMKLKSGGPRIVGGTLPSDGELAIDLAAKPLYEGLWAMGGGVTWTVGVADRTPPVINVDYPNTLWISPNNDGKSDALEFPITITDQRYISEWIFEITNEAGEVIRTYRNKERRPETQGVKNFMDRLLDVKSGVEVPASMRWDGILESGAMAPDGFYGFRITARDDNDNIAVSQNFTVAVDCTPPDVTIAAFTGDDNIYSPDGDGYKDSLTLQLTGSKEDNWEGGIYDSQNNKVKTFNFTNTAPSRVDWNGTDDNNEIVGDGVYQFRIAAMDRAANSGNAELGNIIVNTVQPQITLTIADAWFSPNSDGIKDTMSLTLGIPVTDGIIGWELLVTDSRNETMRGAQGTGTPPQRVEFDGKSDAGTLLREGVYEASLTVRYRNGYISTAASPKFTLDVTTPRAAVRIDDNDQGLGQPAVFSPNNNGVKDELFIIQEGTSEVQWVGQIRSTGESGAIIRTFRFNGVPSPRVNWNGSTNSGSIAPDGVYVYELSSTDLAGNSGRSDRVEFELNTRETPVFITTDLRAFSPNGDGVKDNITIQPQILETTGVMNWKLDIFSANGSSAQSAPNPASILRTFTGTNSVPASIIWDGKDSSGAVVHDGNYAANLNIEYRSGSRPSAVSLAFVLDVEAPRAEESVPFTIFAPNGNGRRDFLPISVATEGNDEWNAVITDNRSTIIRAWNWIGQPPESPLIWEGTDQAGNIVPDGTYGFALTSTDEAGNSTRRNISSITVDARIPRTFLTASAPSIAPKPNQAAEAMNFSVILTPREGIEAWKLEIKDEDGSVFRSFSGTDSPPPASIGWNGNDDRGIIREGKYTPSLSVSYVKGDEVLVSAPEITVDVSGPKLDLDYSPQYFSPDNDGVEDELLMSLSAEDVSPIAYWNLEIRETQGTRQLFYRIEGRGSPSDRIIWNGRSSWGELVQGATDYSYTYSATDSLGNSSSVEGTISTDVLVIRDGDMLKINVPSITFRANHADFIDLPPERIETNNRVLRRVAEILNKFRDYRVTIEGHANPILGTAREETEELQPLSDARANTVIDILTDYGVGRARLNAVGRGGKVTVASAQDPDNNWKNRRVEFILIK